MKIEDWSALTDTSDAVAFINIGLLTVTILLNAMMLYLYRNRLAE
ncbi:hypothetical protein [Oceanobacillus kapialis]